MGGYAFERNFMFAYGYLHGTLSKTLFWRRVCLGRNSNFCLSYEVLLELFSNMGILMEHFQNSFSGEGYVWGETQTFSFHMKYFWNYFPTWVSFDGTLSKPFSGGCMFGEKLKLFPFI
jgi:hypothetical protein